MGPPSLLRDVITRFGSKEPLNYGTSEKLAVSASKNYLWKPPASENSRIFADEARSRHVNFPVAAAHLMVFRGAL